MDSRRNLPSLPMPIEVGHGSDDVRVDRGDLIVHLVIGESRGRVARISHWIGGRHVEHRWTPPDRAPTPSIDHIGDASQLVAAHSDVSGGSGRRARRSPLARKRTPEAPRRGGCGFLPPPPPPPRPLTRPACPPPHTHALPPLV